MKKRYIALGLVLAVIAAATWMLWPVPEGPRPDLDLPLAPQAADLDAHRVLPQMPPVNRMAAQGVNPLPHGEPAQQDSTVIAGPMDRTRQLQPEELAFAHLGPGYFGAFNSSVYAGGRRILWANGVNGLYKLDYETYEILDHLPSAEADEYTREWTEQITADLDDDNGVWAIPTAYKALTPLMSLSGVYAAVGSNNRIYLARKDGSILAYGDAVEDDPASKIEQKASFRLPDDQTGPSVGMNVMFDGWITFPTENGYLIVVSPDLSDYRSIRLDHADTDDLTSQGVDYGWVRNSIAVDDAGGIYVASRGHMHKVVWDGDQLSPDPADGAWSAEYRNGTGAGAGATPSLMGFGEEDRFVVITDGDIRMNVTLFWRDGIPEDWE